MDKKTVIPDQVRIFGRVVHEVGDLIKIEGEAPMTEDEVRAWIERQATIQCRHCGEYAHLR